MEVLKEVHIEDVAVALAVDGVVTGLLVIGEAAMVTVELDGVGFFNGPFVVGVWVVMGLGLVAGGFTVLVGLLESPTILGVADVGVGLEDGLGGCLVDCLLTTVVDAVVGLVVVTENCPGGAGLFPPPEMLGVVGNFNVDKSPAGVVALGVPAVEGLLDGVALDAEGTGRRFPVVVAVVVALTRLIGVLVGFFVVVDIGLLLDVGRGGRSVVVVVLVVVAFRGGNLVIFVSGRLEVTEIGFAVVVLVLVGDDPPFCGSFITTGGLMLDGLTNGFVTDGLATDGLVTGLLIGFASIFVLF